MKKVKLVLMEDVGDDYCSKKIVRDSITDWEELSDEDFKFLKDNFYRLNNLINIPGYAYNLHVQMIIQDDTSIQTRIRSIKAAIERDKKAEEDRKKAEAVKRAETERKRVAKRLAKQAQEYEALVATHGEQEAKVIWKFIQDNTTPKKKTR